MPANTPRGYPYPLFTDPQNFPTALQNLAVAVDTDVQARVDSQAATLNEPGARVSAGNTIAIPTNTDVTLPWVTEEYDNAGLWAAGSPNWFAVPTPGLYLISAWGIWSNSVNLLASGCSLRLNSSVAGVVARNDTRRTLDAAVATLTIPTRGFVSTLHETTAVNEQISVVARTNLAIASAITTRGFSITKISEDN